MNDCKRASRGHQNSKLKRSRLFSIFSNGRCVKKVNIQKGKVVIYMLREESLWPKTI